MSVLALCPSRGRPAAAAEALASFLDTRRDPASRLLFVVDRDDPTQHDYPVGATHLVTPGGTMAAALSAAAGDRSVLRDATVVGMIGDDCRFRTPGWDVTFRDHLATFPGIAYGDDGFQHERLVSHWWVSRPIVDALGMFLPGLRHFYMDNFWLEVGQGAECLRFFPDVLIEHLHPLAGKASEDDTYRRAGRHAAHDRAWFGRWQRRGRAQDVARVKALIRSQGPRRVLADWHHPALWESLSILFEDRFGWQLYSPIGTDWKRLGWRLENATPGWSADDYLVFEDAVPVGDHWERREPEYPSRPRKMVTADQFDALSWDVIVASVPVHQKPFADLAHRRSARFVNHVGDARRNIDLSLRGQVILASANVRRATVVHHQEFDRDLFGWSPPVARDTVTSLMLRLDSTSCPHTWLSGAPGVRWSAVDAQTPRDPGYLAPMSRVADRLRSTGWLWHDKRIGDGFGHVLWTAASVGRPLIGHASHYRGMLGEGLWSDLRTCIDLDRHDEHEALRLWRAISADPEWHADLCRNIRDRFEQLVDFDAEASRIRAALA